MEAPSVPLPTLLSQALVAFTIEFDNEFERRMPHRTTALGVQAGSRHAPWLVSMVMWSNLMRLVGEQGVRAGELPGLARITKEGMHVLLAGMHRWGYIKVAPDPADSGPKPPRRDWLVRPTAAGRQAQAVWRPLFGVIEKRWVARLGGDEIGRLRESLAALVSRLDVELPEYLPVLRYGLFAERIGGTGFSMPVDAAARMHLPALLSKLLLAFTLEFEQKPEVSLAIGANVLRLLDEEGVPTRDLPRLSGVSKEAIKMSVNFLQKRRYVKIEANVVRLTAKGRKAQEDYRRLLDAVEQRWQARFGEAVIRGVREPLERLAGDLFRGLEPHAGGWRATVRKPQTLPHYPMVLHRGGYPDGS